jgi:hypothetical protein
VVKTSSGESVPDQDLPVSRLADWEQERLLHLVALSHAGIDLADRSSLGTTGSHHFFVSS